VDWLLKVLSARRGKLFIGRLCGSPKKGMWVCKPCMLRLIPKRTDFLTGDIHLYILKNNILCGMGTLACAMLPLTVTDINLQVKEEVIPDLR
jgi:hypothetical protein